MYPDDFLAATNDLIDNWEGGYVNDPNDPGGETKYGISKHAYPHEDIKGLTRDRAMAIYYRDFWLPCASGVKDPVMLAKVFNMGVLIGCHTAIRLSIGCDSLDEYRRICARHFQAIVIAHPVCAKYLRGWERRALA